MTKEQFFKAIDGVDDKLLKEAEAFINRENEYSNAQHGAAYRFEHRRKPLARILAIAAASLAAVVALGFFAGIFLNKQKNTPPVYPGDSQHHSSSVTDFKPNESSVSLPHTAQTKPLSENYMMDVCFSEEELGSAAVSMRPVGISETKTVTAYLQTRIAQYSGNYTDFAEETVTLRLFVFADGKPIDFALDGSDYYDQFHYIGIKTHDGNDTVSVTAINFKADPSMHTISFIGSFDRIEWFDMTEKNDFSIYSGIISATAYNYEAVGELPESGELGTYIEADLPAHGYLQMSKSSGYYDEYIGVGYKGQYLRDSSLYIKFNGNYGCPYYLIVLQNDEPAAVFYGQYSYLVTCRDDLYMYEVKQSYLGIRSNNIIQAVAIPAAPSTDADYKFFATQKEAYHKGYENDE